MCRDKIIKYKCNSISLSTDEVYKLEECMNELEDVMRDLMEKKIIEDDEIAKNKIGGKKDTPLYHN